MTDARSQLDPRDTLATCFACGAVPRRSCVACGRLFCGRHGGERLVRRQRGIVRRTLCDDCTPNQRRLAFARVAMGVVGAVGLVAFVLFFAFVVSSMLTGLPDPRSNPFAAFGDFVGHALGAVGFVASGAIGAIAEPLGVPPAVLLVALVVVVVFVARAARRRRAAGATHDAPDAAPDAARDAARAAAEARGASGPRRGDDHERGGGGDTAATLTASDDDHGSFEGRLERLVALADGLRPRARYRRLSPPELDLPRATRERLAVYAASDDEGTYLVVPTRYVVTRTDDTAAPALSMVAVLDPEVPRSSQVVFEAALAPDLLPYHLDDVRVAVAASGSSDEPDEPRLHLPSDLPDAPEVTWTDPLTSLASVVRDGDALVVRIVANGIGQAAAVAARIRPGPDHLGLGGTVRFDLGDQQSASASLLVHLGRTVGPAATTVVDGASGEATVTNRTESRLLLHALRAVHAEPTRSTTHQLEPPETLEPGGECTVRVDTGVVAALPLYEIHPAADQSLSSLRVDVGNLEIVLVVDTDLQPHERFETVPGSAPSRVALVRVDLEWDERSPTVASLRRSDDRFVPAVVPLTVPLDRYLEPEQRLVRYRATFHFEDDSHLASAWLEHNYGDTRLTIGRRIVSDLASPAEA